uniref:Putative secreted protein n=1 Tax=Anopheles triannulatus TaxID=58253 RepID=A0A2M4B3T0_9DIPT
MHRTRLRWFLACPSFVRVCLLACFDFVRLFFRVLAQRVRSLQATPRGSTRFECSYFDSISQKRLSHSTEF